MKVGLATVSWRGPGSVLGPGKVSREVKWSGMGLGWCAVVPALTDLTFRCIPTHDHPNAGHAKGFDPRTTTVSSPTTRVTDSSSRARAGGSS